MKRQMTRKETKQMTQNILKEFHIKEKKIVKTFDYSNFVSKTSCTALYYGEEQIEQQCFVCTICDPLKKRKMCAYCHKTCHEGCRKTRQSIPESVKKLEKMIPQKFACQCGLALKHCPEIVEKKDSVACSMMQLDSVLGIEKYRCEVHSVTVCCICAVVCHKECKVSPEEKKEGSDKDCCHCISDYHSNFNELALSFPLEEYKNKSGADIWPVQILNILFSTKTTFSTMGSFFKKALSEEFDFTSLNNKTVIDKFVDLLELFSDTFNRRFKTYYYCKEMLEVFPYEMLFSFIQKLEIKDEQTTIIKFRMLFILLFMHLRRDFQNVKGLTSNDFLTGNVIQRLTYKSILKSETIFTEAINEKYLIRGENPIKTFALQELCNLITKGMNFAPVEENQDEFEIGLKMICFMIKRMMFEKEDLMIFIDSLYDFHTKFFEYITSEKNNIYALIDIFDAIIEICFMICVNYNDLIISDYIDGKTEKLEDFIHSKSNHSNKLFTMVLKNCDLFTKHYGLLIKPVLNTKDKEQQDIEKMKRAHKLLMQNKILSETTGVKAKMPENGGLFSDKTVNVFIETLKLFTLADNSYEKQLEGIDGQELKDYYQLKKNLTSSEFFEIMQFESEKGHSNILYNLKMVVEEIYFNLFTSSYSKNEEDLEKKLRTRILNACDEINKNLDNFTNRDYLRDEEGDIEEKNEIGGDDEGAEGDDAIVNKILKEIGEVIVFAKNSKLKKKKVRELIVDNFIVSQIDETLFKGLFFLTNIKFPNIISVDLVKLIFHFLSIFLISKKGVAHIIVGKNIENLIRLLKRFGYNEKNKNINETKGRTTDFNINCNKVVIHFLCLLTKLINVHKIKTLKCHKTLPKFRKVIFTHLKYFAKNTGADEEAKFEFKSQLRECIKIFNNISDFFTYDEYEIIKSEVINLFEEVPFKFLSPESFTKLLDKKEIKFNDAKYMKKRKIDLSFYFQFLELITKNTFYVYEIDKNKKKLISIILKFIDIKNFSGIMEASSDLLKFSQKKILLRFMRTYYLMDYLDPINYMKKKHLLTTNGYKKMLRSNLIQDKKVTQYLSTGKNNAPKTAKDIAKLQGKLDLIDELIILMDLFTREIQQFPKSIIKENNEDIKNYVSELVFACHEISNTVYLSKSLTNKIMPYYYKLVKSFLLKKKIFKEVINDINEIESKKSNKYTIDPENYLDYEEDSEEIKILNSVIFNIFDKETLYTYIIEAIFEIYKETKINNDLCLKKFLEIYDVFNEANFPPFSLIEVKDYEYFYETEGNEDNKEDGNDGDKKEEGEGKDNGEKEDEDLSDKLNDIKENYIEQFKSISTTSFLGVLSGDSTDKKVDYGAKYVNLFQSFINSSVSNNSNHYRALLCIMDKMLFYDGEHMQGLFQEMIYDKYFFKNFNRELNYYIVLTIDSAAKYNICDRCAEITDKTKLTIQFLQLLGEGFNTDYHGNILKGEVKESKKKKKNDNDKNENSSENEEEDEENEILNNIEITNQLVDNSIKDTIKSDLRKEKEVPLVDVDVTIYDTMISNLRRIYHLMELGNASESELAFDKLCVLSSNLIDFIIEYIDTTKDLNYIINNYMNSLVFGKKDTESKNGGSGYSFMNKGGILPVFTMKIAEESSNSSVVNSISSNIINKKNYVLRKTMLSYMKIKYFQLLKAYLQIGKKKDFVSKLLSHHLGPIQLFLEILYYVKEVINNLVEKDFDKFNYLLQIDDVDSYRVKLRELYMYEPDFRDSVELNVIFKICVIIKIFEDVYNINMLKTHFENESEGNESGDSTNESSGENDGGNEVKAEINENEDKLSNIEDNKKGKEVSDVELKDNEEFKNQENQEEPQNDLDLRLNPESPYNKVAQTYEEIKKEKEKNVKKEIQTKTISSKNLNLNSKFAIAVYKFLDELVLKVEIRNPDGESKKSDSKSSFIKSVAGNITKKIIDLKNKDMVLSFIYTEPKKKQNENDDENSSEEGFESKNEEAIDGDNEAKEEEGEGEEDVDNEGNEKEITFFIKPYISFHLSTQTQNYFINNVDRATATTKYSSLVAFADYCIFEMMYNMKYIGESKFKKNLSNISFYLLQCINYVFILVENALLLYYYYRDHTLSHDKYDVVDESILCKRFLSVVIVLVIKIIILIITCTIWFYFKFIITLQRNIMLYHEKNFIFRRLGQTNQNISHPIIVKLFQNDGSIIDAMSLVNEGIGFFGKLKSILLDTIIYNLEINIFIFSLLLNILFLIFGHPILLSIECIFIATIFPSLLNVFKAFTAKFSSLCACLLFTYLIIYVYNWITIFYMQDAFDLGEVLQYESGHYAQESFCHSSVQCFMVLVNYGTRAGGGIGDDLPVVSFKSNAGAFVGRFFYDVSFFIFVIMIMGNATYGLIVDTFGALRDETYNYENDKENICFICQLTRDGCLLKNINFDNHVGIDHNIWNYIHFMTYLHLFNPNDFTRVEGSVWDRLIEKDYGWIPIEAEDDGDDDGGD